MRDTTAADEPISSEPTFGDRVLAFYRELPRPVIRAAPVEWLDPYGDPEVQRATAAFYGRYYADRNPRLFLFGINPGRFGAGRTGIPFTDGGTLLRTCGIPNAFPAQSELSAAFIERVVVAWGGAEAFYRQIYITGVCPLGLTLRGKNANYYDDRAVLAELEQFLVEAIQRQLGFGALPGVAIVIGAGTNRRVMERLNAEHGFFAELRTLDHPRFIMQYRRRGVDRYVERYCAMLTAALG